MDNNYFGKFEDLLKSCGYRKCTDKGEESKDENGKASNYEIDPTGGATTNGCKDADLDIPFGFQDVDPIFLLVIGEIISNAISESIPLNVAGSFGNWLQLIAQVISMYNAQNQYHQSGPGRYYSPIYKNISNPFCENPAPTDGGEANVPVMGGRGSNVASTNSDTSKSSNGSNRSNRSKSRKSRRGYRNKNTTREIEKLNDIIHSLKNQVEQLQQEVESLKYTKSD